MKTAKLVMTVKQMKDRKAWLAFRDKGIAGTDAAVVMGMSRFKTVHRLWAEKTGRFLAEDISDNEAVHFGALLEEVVAEEFSRRTGKKVKKQGLLQSVEHPWMLASVDRVIVGEEEGLECKTASFLMRKEWEDGYGRYGIPEGYYCQVQWYMAVTGFARWHIACLIGGQHFVMKTIERNEEFIREMVYKANAFWMSVVNDTLPPVDSTDDCAKNLAAVFPAVKDKAMVLPDELDESFELLENFDRQIGLLEKRKALHESRIKSYLKEAEYGRTGSGYYASWKASKRCYKGMDTPIRSFRYGKGAVVV